jgi:hypothetical protein
VVSGGNFASPSETSGIATTGKVHEAVFNVAARIPVKKQMEPGDQFPFDLQELVKEIESVASARI